MAAPFSVIFSALIIVLPRKNYHDRQDTKWQNDESAKPELNGFASNRFAFGFGRGLCCTAVLLWITFTAA